MTEYNRYIKDVISGKVIVCKYVRQAVERQIADLKASKQKDFPYYFDEEEAHRWISFIKMLRHTRGKWDGELFKVQDFQAFRWAVLFGWKRKNDSRRRFRRAYIEVAKKQGKTEEAGAIILAALVIDDERTPQNICAANSRDQAGEVFETAKKMAERLMQDSEFIKNRLRIYAQSIENRDNGGFIKKVSTEASNTEGKHTHFAVIDEVHLFPNTLTIDSIQSGMAARDQPLSYMITTAGFNIHGPCYKIRENALMVLSGMKTDDTFFAIINTLDDGDDWNDRTTWIKANPQIGITPSWEFLEAEYVDAVNLGGEKEVSFKTKHLNMWVGSSVTWISDEIWQACPSVINEDDLVNRDCYAGLDFASVADFTAVCLLFPPEDEDEGEYILKWFFWIPEDVLKIKSRDFPDILNWIVKKVKNDDGELVMPTVEHATADRCIFVTPGNVTDYDYLIEEMNRLRDRYNILSIGYDPHNAWQTMAKLQEEGFEMEPFRTGITNMSAPAKEFERLIKKGAVNHGGNPVMRWMMSNVLPSIELNENLRIKKMSKHQKIDGVVAAVIALGVYHSKPQPETYSKSDAFMI